MAEVSEYFPGNPGRCTLISGKSYEKIVQEKDPGNDHQVARVARYPHVPVPVPVPDNYQTACDDRLKAGPLHGDRPAPGFRRGREGAGPSGIGVADPSGLGQSKFLHRHLTGSITIQSPHNLFFPLDLCNKFLFAGEIEFIPGCKKLATVIEN